MQYTIPKGMFDILPQEPKEENSWRNADHWHYLEEVIHKLAYDYNFKEIRTPIFERTELFVRGVGETSDIVSKEMYTFLDKAERSMSLRPEGTASVMRSYVENHLHQLGSSNKLFYIGPMFRYERPQAGRYRQHHQFGAEAIGVQQPEQDVEMIDLLCELYRRVGLKNLKVMINSVGDGASRENYAKALQDYLQPHFNELSADSQVRFSKNTLRILDSKDPKDQQLLLHAPSILDALNEECKEHFAHVCSLLKKNNIPYVINPKLVRGLDYYNKTVFEITSEQLGSQNTIGGGGRYDGLLASFGGPDLPGVGFATGLERLLQTMTKQSCFFPEPPHPFIYMIGLDAASKELCFHLLCTLRHENIPAEMDLSGKKIQQGLQRATALKAEYCIVLGEEEMQNQKVQLKNMITRESQTILLHELTKTLSILYLEKMK